MSITEWSENILIAELQDEPMFSEDMDTLLVQLDEIARPGDESKAGGKPQKSLGGMPAVILNMQQVSHVNSSNLAQLLKLRKRLELAESRLRICAVSDRVWTVLLITGLDGLFEFTEDVSTALASLQIEGG